MRTGDCNRNRDCRTEWDIHALSVHRDRDLLRHGRAPDSPRVMANTAQMRSRFGFQSAALQAIWPFPTMWLYPSLRAQSPNRQSSLPARDQSAAAYLESRREIRSTPELPMSAPILASNAARAAPCVEGFRGPLLYAPHRTAVTIQSATVPSGAVEH